MSFVDQLRTPAIVTSFGIDEVDCLTASQPAEQEQGNPSGYAFRGRTVRR